MVIPKEGEECMENPGPSRTAVATATHRAAHYIFDGAPKILADPFARSLAGFSTDEEVRTALDAFGFPDPSRLRTVFTVRSRYAEDQLGGAIQRGICQYIILGAGLDSFAYRRPDLMQALHVYEVDHPATQSWKCARVKELGIKSPRTLRHIPIDFEHETLTRGLAAGGVNCNAKAFFSCLGVTQYLTRDVVLNTLREIASATAPGSELVVQFIVPVATLSREEGNLVTAAAARAASMGEPWLSFFAPDDLETNMTQIGFDQIEHFGSEEATEQYLLGRTDGLTLPGFFRMIKARVG
jgi:methyltransferase (TIGR00027 family)